MMYVLEAGMQTSETNLKYTWHKMPVDEDNDIRLFENFFRDKHNRINHKIFLKHFEDDYEIRQQSFDSMESKFGIKHDVSMIEHTSVDAFFDYISYKP